MAVVTYFENKTLAQVLDKALLQAGNGGVEVIAVSREFVSGDAAGMSGGGTAGVGGTLDVVVLRFRTEALTGSNVTIRTTGDLTVRAEDNYGLVAAVVTLAASGTAAVGVNALVSVSFATVRAAIGVENTVEARNVTVQGSSQRDLLSVSASVAGSGVAAVGVNLSVVVAGALMSRDAHDSLYGTVENGGSTYTLYTFTPKGSVSVTLYEQGGSFYKAKTDSQGKEQRVSNNQLILEAFSYFDSKAQRNVELRIYKGQDSQKEITFMEFATYDKDGNPAYVKAGSDGSVVMVDAPATQKISTVESGTDYTVKNITAGENVEIRVNDPNGSLFNGNDDPQAPCVVAKEKATIISAGGAGSIGTEDKPLNIQAKEVEFLNQDMEQVIVKDTYVYIDQGDTSLDGNIVVDGVIWKLETADGSVTAADKTLTVKNGGTASILTNKEPTATSSGNVELKTITVTGKDSTLQVQAPGAVKTEALTVTDGGTVDIDAGTIHVTGNETVTGGSTVTKTAEGNITVDGNREVTGSTLTETSTNGSIAVGGDETVTGGSTVTKDAKGDITVGGDQRVTGSTLTETSSNGSIETKGNVTLADSEAHLTAHKDLTVEGNLAVTGGTLKAQAETGSVTLTKLRTWQTTTDFQAGADMRFDDWMSAESKNTVSVGGTFGVRTQGGTSFETYEQGYADGHRQGPHRPGGDHRRPDH